MILSLKRATNPAASDSQELHGLEGPPPERVVDTPLGESRDRVFGSGTGWKDQPRPSFGSEGGPVESQDTVGRDNLESAAASAEVPSGFPASVTSAALQYSAGRSCGAPIADCRLLTALRPGAEGRAYDLYMAYPKPLLSDDESIVTEFRPHWRLLAVPVAWLVGGIAAIVSVYAFDLASGLVASIVAAVVAVAMVPLVIAPFVRWWFTVYVLTTERLITRSGVIARSGIEIPLENINNVLFNQNVLERILKAGDLLIESAGESGQSRFEDIPRPDEFQARLYRVREARTKALARDEVAGVRVDATQKLERLARLYSEGAVTEEEFETAKRSLLDDI